jgi:CheY-like chemotaxis protein
MTDVVDVLVVDDDPDVREVLGLLLEADGYRVRRAADAASALAAIDEQPPMCVLLDLEMPGMHGVDLARELRAREGANLVLICVTGWQDAKQHEAAERAGVDFVLTKPLDPAKLRLMLPPLGSAASKAAAPPSGGGDA